MKRLLFAALAVAVLGTTASAEAPQAPSEPREKSLAREAGPRYASTIERWRGRPAQRRASLGHPVETTGSEKVYEHLPSVNFCLEGQSGGAFRAPSLSF